ncbi:hypothetical protein V5N11_015912 [Cardamine amara subsp. amara]|uniref:Uncharacterized protein n=1 Tax=Cardamine amara subsp. amara TaxID=228776 RepID=A0ABD0Z4K5_CARAN
MGNEPRFNGKWDFRRKEPGFDDTSSDDPDSNSTRDPIIQNPNPVLDSDQIDRGTNTVTTAQPAKTRKRKSKKDETKPEKAKQVRRRKPKAVPAEENKNKEETVTGMDGVGMFMETLLNDLTASRVKLMDWMKNELCGSSDQNVASQPPLKKRAVAAQRSVKRRTKKKEEEEKSKPDENGQEMNKPNENGQEMVQNGGDLDCNPGALDRFLNSGQGDLSRNYFQQQVEGQQALVVQTEQTKMENLKNEAVKSQKSIVLAIQAPILSQRQKKIREAKSNKNRSSMVEINGSETQKDLNFMTPYAPQLSSSSSMQSLPQLPSSLFPSSSQENNYLASNTNFQLRQPVAQIQDLTEYQTGVIEGQGFGNSLFHNNGYSNGYFSGFPAAFQPNLYADSYNFPAQVNPAASSQQRDNSYSFPEQVNPVASSQQRDNNSYNFPAQVNPATSLQQRDNNSYNFPAQVNPATSSQQRDNNNMVGDLRMASGAITFSGNRFPEADIGNGFNGLSNYRTSSGR